MTFSILPQIQDSLRETALSPTVTLESSLLVLAWAKLSYTERIPADLRLSDSLLDDPKQIESTLFALSGYDAGKFQVFANVHRQIFGNLRLLLPVFRIVMDLMKAGLILGLDATDLLGSAARSSNEEGLLPAEIVAFMVGICAPKAGNSVYLPWDSMGQFAAFAVNSDVEAYVETPLHSAVPALVALLSERLFEVHQGDPIRSPSFIEQGKPRKFDLAIAFPPLGIRYETEVAERDWFGRFPERTTSGSVLAVRHLLWQTKGRVVVAVPNSLLFSTGVELEMRRDLIHRGVIESVVSMRSGLLMQTTLPFSILILDPRGGHEQVHFISADSERFAEPISKARFRLVNLDALIKLVTQAEDSRDSRTVTVKELGPDAQLQVNRYVVPESTRQLLSMIANVETVALRELVQTIRPMPSKPSTTEHTIEAREVGAADIPPYGYIRNPSRAVKIDATMAEKNKSQFLRPLDIVLVVKGSVGKVGIVSQDAPEPGPGGWVAGQSTIVLRASDKAIVDARTLTLQLRSELGQRLLNGIVSGAAIPLIQLRELMVSPILLPTLEEQRRAAEALDLEESIQGKIDYLRLAQSEIAADLWSLNPAKSATVVDKSTGPEAAFDPSATNITPERPARRIRNEEAEPRPPSVPGTTEIFPKRSGRFIRNSEGDQK